MSLYRLPGRRIAPIVATLSLVALCAQSLTAHDGDDLLRGALLPRLSPDGESIVYSYHGSIWRSTRERGEHQQLTANEGFDAYPAWSADGSRIWNVVPSNPSRSSMCPRCTPSTIRRESASPTPHPPGFVVTPGSKSLSRISGSTPGPVSRMRSEIHLPPISRA